MSAPAIDLLPLRPYQSEAIEAIYNAWGRDVARPAIVLPTGTGKTVIFAHLTRQWHGDGRDGSSRTVILVHRDELVQQAVGKLHSVAPHLSIGVVKAERNETDAHVIVASVQTLRSDKRLNQLVGVGLVIVDECHHATAESYLRVLKGLGCYSGRCLAVGVTATMNRTDGAALGHVWQEVVYEKDTIWAIRNGFLSDVKGVGLTVSDFDLANVRSRGGDYSEGDLGHALEDSSAPDVIAKAYVEHAPDKPGLIFTPTVDTAYLMADVMTDAGIPTEAVHGAMARDERRDTLTRFSTGEIQTLSNCMVLTEGYDEPRASVAVIARPTKSASLYVQMVGRVLRPYPGKRQALVLDVAGASARNSLVGLTTLAGSEVYDDESVLEAAERELAEELAAGTLDEESGHGPLATVMATASEQRELDLFHGSRQQWLKTHAGWWFLPAGDRIVALVPSPEPGAWAVAWYNTKSSGGGYIHETVEDLSYAMTWGEAAVAQIPGAATFTAKERRWRKNRATKKQLAYATVLGADVSEEMTGGEVGDQISVVLASRRIDDRMAAWLAAKGRA